MKIIRSKSTGLAALFIGSMLSLLSTGCDTGNRESTDTTANNESETMQRDTAAFNDSIANYNDRKDRDTANDSVNFGYYTMVQNDQGRLGIDKNYTLHTLDSLVRALEFTARKVNYDLGADMDNLGTNIGDMRSADKPLASAQSIKNTFMTVLGIFRSLQEEKYPQLKDRIDDVEEKVKVIDESKPAEQQKDKIKAIFHEMEDLIREMNDEVEEEVKS